MTDQTIIRPTKGDGYPTSVAARANALAADGFDPAAVVRILAREGAVVDIRAVKEWVIDGYRETRREAAQARLARKAVEANGGRIVPRSKRPEYIEGRIVAFGRIGLTVEQIDAAVALDFGVQPGADAISMALHLAGIVPAANPGHRPKHIAVRDCRVCGLAFEVVIGARGRPPTYCEGCNPRKEERRRRAPAVANGDQAAPTTNPTGRHS